MGNATFDDRRSAALAAWAQIRTSQATATTGPDHLAQGRDAAGALRLATRRHLA